jgi:hypothetical protein
VQDPLRAPAPASDNSAYALPHRGVDTDLEQCFSRALNPASSIAIVLRQRTSLPKNIKHCPTEVFIKRATRLGTLRRHVDGDRQCQEVDEIKDIHDKAKALEYYAAQAKNSVFCPGCASATTSACNRNRIVLNERQWAGYFTPIFKEPVPAL